MSIKSGFKNLQGKLESIKKGIKELSLKHMGISLIKPYK